MTKYGFLSTVLVITVAIMITTLIMIVYRLTQLERLLQQQAMTISTIDETIHGWDITVNETIE